GRTTRACTAGGASMKRLLALAGLLVPVVAAAHPLGNFTVNRYAALHVTPEALAVRYVLDLAEIPAFQELQQIDTDGDGGQSASERQVYLDRMADTLRSHLTLTHDGTPIQLEAGERTLDMPPGAGGLPTLRVDIAYRAPLSAKEGAIVFRDDNFSG